MNDTKCCTACMADKPIERFNIRRNIDKNGNPRPYCSSRCIDCQTQERYRYKHRATRPSVERIDVPIPTDDRSLFEKAVDRMVATIGRGLVGPGLMGARL